MTLTTRLRSNITTNIKALRTGHGPEMLLIHGVGMNADYWGNVIDELAGHYTLSIIDLPGHGCSPRLAVADPSLQQFSDVIAQSIKAPTIVVGHSMGALIALDLAVRHSSLVNGIAVLNGIYRRDQQSATAIKLRVSEILNHKKPDHSDTLIRWFGESPTGVYATASDTCRQWLENMEQSAYAQAYQAFANADAPSDAALAAIQSPALFMTGSQEPNSTPAMSKAMHHLLPHSECVIVENAKHMMSLTHGPQVTQHILRFFNET